MTTPLRVARTLTEMHDVLRQWHAAGETHALVPTMGALHDGHLALVQAAKALAHHVVVSIFVNPAQFAPGEDLNRYPRDEAGDFARLASIGCDLVWAPSVAEMYPSGYATRIVPSGAADGLEADFRPDFFSGVATVCCKLFLQVAPAIAAFGEKDYQQLCVVRQMVRDLNLPLAILGGVTVREPDGLAMSSRNRYLSPEQRELAPSLHAVISATALAIKAGADIDVETMEAVRLLTWKGFQVDYVAVRDAETLGRPVAHNYRPLRVLAAVRLGSTRLIDNVPA